MNLSQYIGRGRALLWMLLCSGNVFIFFHDSYIKIISQVAIRYSMLFMFIVFKNYGKENLHLNIEYDIHVSSIIMRMATGTLWIC